ncbi:unnamed protein product [Agarophyton chilense]
MEIKPRTTDNAITRSLPIASKSPVLVAETVFSNVSFLQAAAALASLTPDLSILYTTETLYFLVKITINAVQRPPDTAALQQLQDLLDFYDLTPEPMASYSGGTSRQRLRQGMEVGEENMIGIWLDVYEVMKKEIVLAVLPKCPSGYLKEVSSGKVLREEGH